MDTITQVAIIGVDVSRDWLDVHCLPNNQRLRLPNTDEGHGRLCELALSQNALVCFAATGGQEWRLWVALDASGVAMRQLPPAQIKAHEKLGSAETFEALDAELKNLLNQQIAKLQAQIEQVIATDEGLAATASILRSVPGIGPVASTMLPDVHAILQCRAVDRGNAGTGTHHRRASRSAHRTCADCLLSADLLHKSPAGRGMTAAQCAASAPTVVGAGYSGM